MRKFLLIVMFLTSMGIMAQKVNIEGLVTDENGEPLSFVSVLVKGTQIGTTTDDAGKFKLPANKSSIVLFSLVGYQTKELLVTDQTNYKVTLKDNSIAIKDVVVTALGIKRDKKSLGYAVQDVKADELTKGGNTDVAAALQGKVAGLTINSSGTGAGGSSKIVIRGNSSLSDNNEPLWVVDGVPYDNSTENGNFQWGGYDRAGGAFDLNPDDIESISVLKGASAAALYGSRAGNGVIVVTTKKGTANKNLGITYTYKASVSPIAYSLDFQNKYGQGDYGVFNTTSKDSWGPVMSNQQVEAWWDDTQTTAFLLQDNPLKHFYRSTSVQSHNVSISSGSDKSSFRASFGNDYTKPSVRNETIQKTSFDFVSRHNVNKFLDFETKANYVRTTGKNRPQMGFYSTMSYLYSMPRSIQLADLNTYKFNAADLADGTYTEQNWITPSAGYRNPYFLLEQENNNDVRDRYFGYAQANITFTKDLKLKIKQGLDYSDSQETYIYKYADAIVADHPSMSESKSTSRELNTEFLLSYNKKLKDFDLGLSVGGNRMYSHSEGLWASSGKFSVTGATYISLGTAQTASNSISQKEVQSTMVLQISDTRSIFSWT